MKRIILLALISVITGKGLLYSQTTKKDYEVLMNESTDIFRMLEATKGDSIEYAQTLFIFSKFCRKLGLCDHSLIIANASLTILEEIKNTDLSLKEKCELYTDLININNFIADLLGARSEKMYHRLTWPQVNSAFYTDKINNACAYYRQEALEKGDSIAVENINKYINNIPDNSVSSSAILWQNDDIEEALGTIVKSLECNSDRITTEQKRTLLNRKKALTLLQSTSKKNIDQFVQMADSFYHPTTLSQLLYDQRLPDYYLMLKYAAHFYEKHKNPQKALLVYEKIKNSLIQQLQDDIPYLLPAEKTSLWRFVQPYFDDIQEFAFNNYTLPGIAKLLYDSGLLKKELFEVTSPDKITDIYKEKDEKCSSLIAQRDSLIADESTYKTSLDGDYISAVRNAVQIMTLEKTLISYLKEKQHNSQNFDYSWENISSKLSPHEAVVDIIRLLHPDNPLEAHYWAIVFKGGDTSPQLVRMFPSADLATFYYSDKAYEKIWRPIEKYIEKCSDIYLAFEGYMQHYTFSDIKADKLFLCDKYNFHYLMSTKDLISIKSDLSAPDISQRSIFVFGGAEFGLPLSEIAKDRGQGFAYLPGTIQEVNEISQLLIENKWDVHKYIGKAATEKNLKELPDKNIHQGILHLSTHGFYLPYDRSISSHAIQTNGKSGLYEPLLRTGFVLTGANEAWTNEKVMDGTDDGIVTAFEIGNLNLKNIELVVLSTCKSGLGEDHEGEGLSGLVRAFRIAGVRYILVTLDNVSDKYTAEFMIHFYTLVCKTGSIHKAFIQTQREMKNMYPDEYFNKWADFKLIE